MTKQGPAAVRAVLVEAAQTAKSRPPLAAVYDSLRRRRGKQIATVAIARRLLAQSFHILEEVNLKIATGEADRCAGRARRFFCAALSGTAEFLTEQPDPGLIVMRSPTSRSGPNE
jgi:hypothetical protein